MPDSPLYGLPEETLFSLLIPALKELLEAIENKDMIAIRVKKKQCEAVYNAIIKDQTVKKTTIERAGLKTI